MNIDKLVRERDAALTLLRRVAVREAAATAIMKAKGPAFALEALSQSLRADIDLELGAIRVVGVSKRGGTEVVIHHGQVRDAEAPDMLAALLKEVEVAQHSDVPAKLLEAPVNLTQHSAAERKRLAAESEAALRDAPTRNPFRRNSWSLTEQGRLHRHRPDLYRSLRAEAEADGDG